MNGNDQETELIDGEIINNGLDRLRVHLSNQEPQRIDVQENAMLDIQIATAKRYPRSIAQFRKEALSMATLDQETAASCFYSMPRGGKPIEGPSVRLAEICAAAWGHIHASTTIFEIGQKEVIARAVAWDMQSNLRIGVENRRRITNKNGGRFNDDMILVTCNAALSIALRNAIFRIIPGAYVNSVYLAARKVAIGDAKTLAARRADMIAAFAKMGVTTDKLFIAVEANDIEDIGLEKLVTLGGIYNAIKDGAETIESFFPEEKPEDKKKSLTDKIRGQSPAAQPKPEAKPEPKAEPKADSKPPAKAAPEPTKPAAKPAEKPAVDWPTLTEDLKDEIHVAVNESDLTMKEALSGFKSATGEQAFSVEQLNANQARELLKKVYAANKRTEE